MLAVPTRDVGGARTKYVGELICPKFFLKGHKQVSKKISKKSNRCRNGILVDKVHKQGAQYMYASSQAFLHQRRSTKLHVRKPLM